jgi:putative colanic acid biosynthesis acetyltransferase WcaF
MQRLDIYDNGSFDRGRPKWVEALWLFADWLLIRSALPGSTHRRIILRMFGARIGKGAAIKPGVRVKFPWRLMVGDFSWIGEDVWIDNLTDVTIGSHCCVSQTAYLCTGSHDWASPDFKLIVRPIHIGNHAWVAARGVVGPGVTLGEGSVLTIGSVATSNLQPWSIHSGVPAKIIKARKRQSRHACTN